MEYEREGSWIRAQDGTMTYVGWWKEFLSLNKMVILRDQHGREFLVARLETDAESKKLYKALYAAIEAGEFLFDAEAFQAS